LEYFINLCKEQFSIIRSQKFNIEFIDKLILEISECENRLDELEKANNRHEIVELIEEFSAPVPEIEKIELPDEKKVYEGVYQEVLENTEKKPSNMVVRIKDPIKINVKSVTDTAKLVMKKVVIVLEPKKFNNKRDKLKEAELELEKEKNEKIGVVKVSTDEKEIIDDNVLNDGVLENVDNLDNSVKVDVVKNENNISESNEIVNTIEDTHDIFLDDDPDEIGIELDTREVFGDASVKETKELSEIKINASDPSNMSIPTEIFIEEPPVEKEVDLFKVTDPFLDDNHFELNDGIPSDEIRAIMPSLGSIGTVKPNNALSKIEDVVKESEDVILPNLGLVDGTKQEVPIVSENYIS